MTRFGNIIALIDGYAQLVALASQPPWPKAAHELATEIGSEAAEYLARLPNAELDRFAIYYVDKYYRIYNQLEELDSGAFPPLAAIGAAFAEHVAARSRPIAYLVDNQLSADRVAHLSDFFSPLGFVAASLDEFAEQLAAPEPNRGLALKFVQVEKEAKILCQRLVDAVIEDRRNLLLVSAHHAIHEWRELATPLARAGCLVIFRNDTPLDGSEVHVLSSA